MLNVNTKHTNYLKEALIQPHVMFLEDRHGDSFASAIDSFMDSIRNKPGGVDEQKGVLGTLASSNLDAQRMKAAQVQTALKQKQANTAKYARHKAPTTNKALMLSHQTLRKKVDDHMRRNGKQWESIAKHHPGNFRHMNYHEFRDFCFTMGLKVRELDLRLLFEKLESQCVHQQVSLRGFLSFVGVPESHIERLAPSKIPEPPRPETPKPPPVPWKTKIQTLILDTMGSTANFIRKIQFLAGASHHSMMEKEIAVQALVKYLIEDMRLKMTHDEAKGFCNLLAIASQGDKQLVPLQELRRFLELGDSYVPGRVYRVPTEAETEEKALREKSETTKDLIFPANGAANRLKDASDSHEVQVRPQVEHQVEDQSPTTAERQQDQCGSVVQLRDLSVAQVGEFLRQHQLGQWAGLFALQRISGRQLEAHARDDDFFLSVGMDIRMSRQRLMQAIAQALGSQSCNSGAAKHKAGGERGVALLSCAVERLSTADREPSMHLHEGTRRSTMPPTGDMAVLGGLEEQPAICSTSSTRPISGSDPHTHTPPSTSEAALACLAARVPTSNLPLEQRRTPKRPSSRMLSPRAPRTGSSASSRSRGSPRVNTSSGAVALRSSSGRRQVGTGMGTPGGSGSSMRTPSRSPGSKHYPRRPMTEPRSAESVIGALLDVCTALDAGHVKGTGAGTGAGRLTVAEFLFAVKEAGTGLSHAHAMELLRHLQACGQVGGYAEAQAAANVFVVHGNENAGGSEHQPAAAQAQAQEQTGRACLMVPFLALIDSLDTLPPLRGWIETAETQRCAMLRKQDNSMQHDSSNAESTPGTPRSKHASGSGALQDHRQTSEQQHLLKAMRTKWQQLKRRFMELDARADMQTGNHAGRHSSGLGGRSGFVAKGALFHIISEETGQAISDATAGWVQALYGNSKGLIDYVVFLEDTFGAQARPGGGTLQAHARTQHAPSQAHLSHQGDGARTGGKHGLGASRARRENALLASVRAQLMVDWKALRALLKATESCLSPVSTLKDKGTREAQTSTAGLVQVRDFKACLEKCGVIVDHAFLAEIMENYGERQVNAVGTPRSISVKYEEFLADLVRVDSGASSSQ